ncbi:uncharacterized protein LOC143360925 isoform X2 [Halictus rubicundus]|uniref:uncharacterized protein LOC143360925 isoform X2 n=1 Tax=Halictus rubicundus TaxID=77578 RepID=UPI0040369D26
MSVEKDLRYVYGWNYYTMRFIGIWPEERKWYQPSSYQILIPVLLIFFFVTAPQTANIPNVYGDMYMLVENLSMGNITITISMLKTIAFWFNGKPLKSLLKCMASDWSIKAKPSDREAMMNVARITRKTIVTSTVMVNIVVFAYVIRYSLTAKYTDRKLFFHASFPYNIDTSPNLQLTVCGQLIAAMYAASSYTAVDTFIAMLVLHICGQLTILRQDIMNLRENGNEKLMVVLKKIVQRHEYINTFAATIENCFNMMLLLQMLGCTLQLCFQCFQAIMTFGGEEKSLMYIQIFFLSLYVVYVMAQLYLYCYVGDRLTVENILKLYRESNE